MNARAVKNTDAVTLNSSIADQIAAASAGDVTDTVTDATVVSIATDAFGVDDDIAIPTGRASRETKYNWDLKVGQSQFYYEAGTDQTKFVNRIQQACFVRNKKGEGKFVVKKWTGPAGQLGARVWRTK